MERKPIDPQVIQYNERLKTAAQRYLYFSRFGGHNAGATTRGFIDRVLSPGVEYDHHPRGFGLVTSFKNLKSITVITTMNKA